MEGGTLRIEARDDGPGVRIIDPIERKRVVLETDRPVSPTDAPTDQFRAPVDVAVSVDANTLWYEYGAGVYVRDEEGELVCDMYSGTTESFPSDSYVVEGAMPVKVYFRVEGPMTIRVWVTRTEIELDATDLTIGARSFHRQPEGVIETTSRPTDIRRAVSMLSSSLKTTSPERSFPTLRGHPPLIELGDTFSVPSMIERPQTGIQLEVPDDRSAIFEAAPLAFYLGAEVVDGPAPLLRTNSGWEHPLEDERPISHHVERVLKQVFLLDCITRTEGLYPLELYERTALERDVDLDFETLYELPIADRLERYLEVPFGTLEPHVPRWKSTAHLAMEPEQVEILPFALDDLALVRVQSPTEQEVDRPQEPISAGYEDPLYRALSEFSDTAPLLELEPTDSLENTWFGEGVPTNGAMGSLQAFKNRLDRQPSEDSISVTVVQNDPEMAAEGGIDAVYGTRTDLPFDVTRHRNLSRSDLRSVLQESSDFFHFIGHVTDEGLQSADGFLDTRTLDSVAVDSFLLNACKSDEQGRGLVEAGAIGGVVTINDVVNTEAVRIGKTLAQLLNAGFHLGAAVDIASKESVIGALYTVIGDSGVQIAQTDTGSPSLPDLTSVENGFRVKYDTYPSGQVGMGSLSLLLTSNSNRHFITSGTISAGTKTLSEIQDLFELENQPLRIDGQLRWSDDIDPEEFL